MRRNNFKEREVPFEFDNSIEPPRVRRSTNFSVAKH